MASYRDLEVWQFAMELAVGVYQLTRAFPPEERYGLTSQIRRSACSVAANIAEGYGRNATQDYLRFLRIARGSLKECETHLILAHRVGLTAHASVEPLLESCDRIGRMINGLMRAIIAAQRGEERP